MKLLRTIAEVRAHRKFVGDIAFVPTMGALHAGHMSLIEIAARHMPRVAVSIFVNPTQFGPREDLSKYPRPLEADLAKCEAAGVDFVFCPDRSEMYPDGESTGARGEIEMVVDLPELSGTLEGKFRPTHFRGVCQVVAKLFNIVQPNVACFGQKDFQQLRVIRAMTDALNFPVEIIACPTLRDPDGLAMSSRNVFLVPDERKRALAISRALFMAQKEYDAGVRDARRLVTSMQNILLDKGDVGRVPFTIDYVAAVDFSTLKPVDFVTQPCVLAIAARVGATRLIDNVVIGNQPVS